MRDGGGFGFTGMLINRIVLSDKGEPSLGYSNSAGLKYEFEEWRSEVI
ncbi:MAG: hypothetical protein KDD43_04690 [Bdellovibrionales bacterium]|nr:hypothetical protein [Bdellovibrionales bacterium]